MASQNSNDEAGDLTAPIQELVQEPSMQPLLNHHRAVFQKNAVDTIARELLTLTQGVAWASDPVSFVSSPVEQAKGWRQNKITFLGVHALIQQGVRRANSSLFNRQTTQRGEMDGRPEM